jgi:hypothetical protein
VLCRCLKWLRLVLCRQLTVFGIANLLSRLCRCRLCFAIASNGLRFCFAVSLRSLPSPLCRHCSCFALVLRCRGKLIALVPSRRMACAHALPLAHVCCPCCFAATAWELPCFFAVVANGSRSRFAISLRCSPSRHCRLCLCVAFVLCRHGKLLTLARRR